MNARELHANRKRLSIGWRARPTGWQEMVDARVAYEQYGEAVRQKLPFQTIIAYAYSPRETGVPGGEYHIQLTEAITYGRLKRQRHDTLCKPLSKFWELAASLGDKPSCLKCIEAAEKIIALEQGGPA